MVLKLKSSQIKWDPVKYSPSQDSRYSIDTGDFKSKSKSIWIKVLKGTLTTKFSNGSTRMYHRGSIAIIPKKYIEDLILYHNNTLSFSVFILGN